MRKLVRAGRGEQHRRGVHVHVRLAREGRVEAREIHRAHDFGKINALGLLVGHVEQGKFAVKAVVDLIGIVEDVLPVGGENAVRIARDLLRRERRSVGKIARDAQQVLIRDGLGREAGHVAEVA